MIIIDMNQITVASLMMHLNMTKSKEPDENIVRHMILNSVRMYRTQFTEEYGEVVLAYDSKHYWRRDFFPNYKASRRKGREKSDLDWDAIFEVLNKIKAEFKDNLPYKYLEVYGAEADDIIATLVKNKKEPIMIPTTYIKEHILKGDTSDGVPNVLSPDNTFVDGLRQKPLTKKKIESWLNANIDDLPDEVKRNYQRNETLISLDKIPSELETEINEVFDNAPCGNRSKLLNYFIQSRLKNLTETIGEF